MGPGAVITLVVTLICAADWAGEVTQPGQQSYAVFAGLFTVVFAALTVILILGRRRDRGRLRQKTYDAALVVTCVVATLLGIAVCVTPSTVADATAGSVTVKIDGQLTGETYGARWAIHDTATVTTSTYPETRVTFDTVPGSTLSASFDVQLVLADGSTVQCNTVRRVDWGTTADGGRTVGANCPTVPYSQLKQLKAVHVG